MTLQLHDLFFNYYVTKLVMHQALEAKEPYIFVEPLDKAINSLISEEERDTYVDKFIADNKALLIEGIYRFVMKRRSFKISNNGDFPTLQWFDASMPSTAVTAYEYLVDIIVLLRGYHVCDHSKGSGVCTCRHRQSFLTHATYYHWMARSFHTKCTTTEYDDDLMRYLKCPTIRTFSDTINRWLSQSRDYNCTEGRKFMGCLVTLNTLGFYDPKTSILPVSVYLGPVVLLNPHIDGSKSFLELVMSRYIHDLITEKKASVVRDHLRIRVCDEPKGKVYLHHYPLIGLDEHKRFMQSLLPIDNLLIIILQYLTNCT